MKNPKFSFFVTGCDRSGTTLLNALLSSHKEVGVINDTHMHILFRNYYNASKIRLLFFLLKRLSRNYIPFHSIFQKRFNKMKFYFFSKKNNKEKKEYFEPEVSLLPDKDKLISYIRANFYLSDLREYASNNYLVINDVFCPLKDKSRIRVDQFLQQVILGLIPQQYHNKKIIGEKSPYNTFSASWLHSIYPGVKFLRLIRNPYTNIASLMNRNNPDVEYATKMYKSFFSSTVEKELQNLECHLLRYEDLVYDTTKSMQKVFTFLGVSASEISEEINYYTRENYIGKKIDPNKDIKLIKRLTQNEKEYIRSECSEILQRYYPDIESFYKGMV